MTTFMSFGGVILQKSNKTRIESAFIKKAMEYICNCLADQNFVHLI